MKARKPGSAVKAETTGLPPGIFLFMAVAAFYVWTATSSQYAFVWGTKKTDHYNLLAEGFLKGHLYLAMDPPKELLALKDPLDPVENAPYRLHDASLYNGHYYVYFGPVPVLTLYLPWRLITGWSIPNNLAGILYLLAGYIFSCLLLFRLLAACGIRPSWLQKRLAMAALGLCQTAPIILRRAYMYETAVAAAFCFAVAALYYLARYVLDTNPRPWHAVAAGLFLGFTPGCRPNYVVFVAVVGAGYLLYLKREQRLGGRDLYLFAAPVAVCALLLAWNNYARFGSPLELGMSYQLVGSLADRGVGGKLSGLLPNLYRLLIQGPVWVRHFPFFELASAGDFGAEVWRPGTDRVEAICGIFVASPLCLAGLAFPLVLRRFRDRVPPVPRLLLLTIYVSVFASLASVVLTVNGVTERYEMDFAPELLLLALFVLILFGAGRAATIVLAAGVAASALITACLSINGYENELIERNFAAFDSIARFVGDDDNTLRRVVYGIRLNGAIAFHQQPAGRREALVATGVPRRSNCVFVEYLDGGRIRLATYMSDLGTTYGPPIPVTANKAYVLTTEYRIETRHLTMKLDETAALDVATFFFPTSFADAAVLRNPNRMPPNIETFSGELNAPQGLQFAAAAAQ